MTLEYVIFGQARAEQGKERRKLLLFNGALPSLESDFYTSLIAMEPLVDAADAAQPGLALVAYDDARTLLVLNQPDINQPGAFTDHYVFIPAEALAQAADQFQSWLAYLPKATGDLDLTLPLLRAPQFTEVDEAARGVNLARLLAHLPAGDFEILLSLLAALIDERLLLISGFPADFNQRLAFIASLQAMLPGKLAARLSFASSPLKQVQRQPHIAFANGANGDEASDAWLFDLSEPTSIRDAPEHAYIEVLRHLWTGEPAALAARIQKLGQPDLAAGQPRDLAEDLRALAERFWVDQRIRSGDEVDTAVMTSILEGRQPPNQNLRRLYVEKLLRNALNNRDSAAGRWVAGEMERDEELDAALAGLIEEMLADQPDAVYVFIRNRLINLGINERWLPRLHAAAQNSLDVAIEEGDIGTLAGWLELIAHEPQAYQLQAILKRGILSAAKRAYDDGELGIQLILMATRRAPEIIDALYSDNALIAALEPKTRAALQNPSMSALDTLIDADKPEHFLLALYNGLSANGDWLVSLAAARRLVSLAQSTQRPNLPAVYRAPALIRLLMTQASQRMSADAVDLLLRYILRVEDRPFIAKALRHLADRDLLFPRLQGALQQDDLPLDKAHAVLNAVSNIKNTPPPKLIACYFSLLDYYQWAPQTQRLIESLARLLAKHHEIALSYQDLWTLFDACQALQAEAATRIAMTRLMAQFDNEADLDLVVAGLARVCRQVSFSKSLQDGVNNWWRAYTHSRAMPQLQRLRRQLDSQRHLDAQKHIIKTVVAMRRWLHSRGPTELAQAINTANIMLEHIAEAFDDANLSETDPRALRREVDRLSADLSSEQRHILANNLRSLAIKITQMAEKRSKPSLMRSDDSIDRQLTQGEANPQGSVDMLKWIAGYLDGAHPQSDD